MELPPGAWSSQRHWHAREDEFVYVLSGKLILTEPDGTAHEYLPGDSLVLPEEFSSVLATLAALGLAGGGFLKFQETGGELPKSGGTKTGGGTQPPTPF